MSITRSAKNRNAVRGVRRSSFIAADNNTRRYLLLLLLYRYAHDVYDTHTRLFVIFFRFIFYFYFFRLFSNPSETLTSTVRIPFSCKCAYTYIIYRIHLNYCTIVRNPARRREYDFHQPFFFLLFSIGYIDHLVPYDAT